MQVLRKNPVLKRPEACEDRYFFFHCGNVKILPSDFMTCYVQQNGSCASADGVLKLL